jgi:hypothetical protein
VRGEARDDWQQAPQPDETPASEEQQHGIKGWLHRLIGGNSSNKPAEQPRSPLQEQIDDFFKGKKCHYHLTEDEETGRRELHIRLSQGRSMIINLNQGGDVLGRVEHDMCYIPRLLELAKLFPYRMTGPRKKIEWITAPRTTE